MLGGAAISTSVWRGSGHHVKLLDTSVAIDHLRAVELLAGLVEADEPLLASEVVRFELLAGVRDREVDALELFLSALSWVPIGKEVARTRQRSLETIVAPTAESTTPTT